MIESRNGTRTIGILGIGTSVPQDTLTNADLEKIVDTTDEWIRTRTGITERRKSRPEEAASDFGAEAARKALEAAGITKDQIGLIICATMTPDNMCPSTACHVQRMLGIDRVIAFDMNAACTGFVYGLTTAKYYLQAGMCDHALVIGVDMLTKFTDYQDRGTCVLFGDGAGAAVLGEVSPGKGLLGEYLSADGRLSEAIHVPAGGSRQPATAETLKERGHYLRMKGNEVFRFAVNILGESVEKAVEGCGLKVGDVDLVIPHQANIRIIEAAAKRLSVPRERFVVNLEKYGNTSAASIPLAMADALADGRIKDGSLLALVAFGGGLTWGATIVRWGR
ncbi:MAG: beta-ketoacyl-ACP synthase III [bacterium]